MKKDMEKIDEFIKEALTQEEAQFYDDLEEQGLFEMVGGLFKGRLRWIIIWMNIVMLVFFAGFLYSAVRFFNTDITSELIQWAVAGILCLMVVSMLKMFAWMQMDKNALLRALKRLELQVAVLAGKTGGK